ncbi:MAG: hypothetical protein P8Z68_13075 [Kineosporiaceae bacterium]
MAGEHGGPEGQQPQQVGRDASAYDYWGQGLSVDVTTDDSANNGAQQLAGYDPHIRPESNWPGLAADPTRIRLEPEALSALATRLEEQARALSLASKTLEPAAAARFGHATWPQALHLKRASDMVTATIKTRTSSTRNRKWTGGAAARTSRSPTTRSSSSSRR